MIKLTRTLAASSHSFLLDPGHIVTIEPASEAQMLAYAGGQTIIQTTDPCCDGIVVAERVDQVALLRAASFNQVRVKNTANAMELSLYVTLDETGAFALIEKALAR